MSCSSASTQSSCLVVYAIFQKRLAQLACGQLSFCYLLPAIGFPFSLNMCSTSSLYTRSHGSCIFCWSLSLKQVFEFLPIYMPCKSVVIDFLTVHISPVQSYEGLEFLHQDIILSHCSASGKTSTKAPRASKPLTKWHNDK